MHVAVAITDGVTGVMAMALCGRDTVTNEQHVMLCCTLLVY